MMPPDIPHGPGAAGQVDHQRFAPNAGVSRDSTALRVFFSPSARINSPKPGTSRSTPIRGLRRDIAWPQAVPPS